MVDARQFAPEPEESRLPWGRIALLAAMCALIAALAYLLFTNRNATQESAAQANADGTEIVQTNGPGEQDLDDILKQEADRVAEAGGLQTDATVASPEGAGGAAADTEVATATADGMVTPAAPGTPGAIHAVLIRSEPSGATVLIDDAEQGTTPAIVSGLSEGRHRVTLRLPGYEEHQRLIHVPDVPAKTPYLLRQRPNTLHVTSEPAGVSVWRGSQWLGITPVLLQDMPTGDTTLTLTMTGCPPKRETVTVSAVRGEQLHVEMKPTMGSLRVATVPPACNVLVDGALVGTTRREEGNDEPFGELSVPNLLVGERVLRVEHPCGAFQQGKLTIVADEELRQPVRLWVPDTQITLLDGTTKTGMLMERNEQGDIVLAFGPKGRTMERYLKPRIREERTLTDDEAREEYQKLVAPATKAEGKEEGAAADEPEPTVPAWGEDVVAEVNGAALGDTDEGGSKVVEVEAQKLSERLDAMPKATFMRQFRDKSIQISGEATGVRRDGIGGVVFFGRRIRCEMARDTFAAESSKLDALQGTGSPITLRGRVQGFIGDRLVVRDCHPIYAVAEEQ
jgi:hypothetical protein